MKAQKGELLAKKKNVADLAQEALNSAALFADDLTTAEKNSEGERLPEDFFAETTTTATTLSEPIDVSATAAASGEAFEAGADELPENEEVLPEEPANEDDFTLLPGTIEADINEGLELGADVPEGDASDVETELDILEGDELDENVEVDAAVFLQEDEETPGFLPEVSPDQEAEILADGETDESAAGAISVEGTELDAFESAAIEDVEFVEDERLESIVESILFASDRPVSLASLKIVFKGTNVTTQKIRRAIDQLSVEYAGGKRGVTLEEAPGGYQLRTKMDNMEFMRRTLKARPFKLSGPALEVLAIVAYKQPTVKFEVDEIRGVESGHLLRALMEKNLVCFDGKSDLPGRPMQYGTTKKFLEIFGLRNLKELPTLSQIDELLPEGIGDEDEKEKQTLSTITDSMAEMGTSSYSQGEDELMKITEQLEDITTSSDFFEKEKLRQKEKRDEEKAQNIREALALSEAVSTRDMNWLKRYEEALAAAANPELQQALKDFDSEADGEAEEGAHGSNGATSAAAAEGDHDEDLNHASDGEAEASDDDDFSEDELPFFGEADDIGDDDASI
jgi:segregation and condensation protein B